MTLVTTHLNTKLDVFRAIADEDFDPALQGVLEGVADELRGSQIKDKGRSAASAAILIQEMGDLR